MILLVNIILCQYSDSSFPKQIYPKYNLAVGYKCNILQEKIAGSRYSVPLNAFKERQCFLKPNKSQDVDDHKSQLAVLSSFGVWL